MYIPFFNKIVKATLQVPPLPIGVSKPTRNLNRGIVTHRINAYVINESPVKTGVSA